MLQSSRLETRRPIWPSGTIRGRERGKGEGYLLEERGGTGISSLTDRHKGGPGGSQGTGRRRKRWEGKLSAEVSDG